MHIGIVVYMFLKYGYITFYGGNFCMLIYKDICCHIVKPFTVQYDSIHHFIANMFLKPHNITNIASSKETTNLKYVPKGKLTKVTLIVYAINKLCFTTESASMYSLSVLVLI